jgi:hypothetical protein
MERKKNKKKKQKKKQKKKIEGILSGPELTERAFDYCL